MHPSTFRGSMLGMIWCSVPSQEVFGSIGYIYIYILLVSIIIIMMMIIIITIVTIIIFTLCCYYYYYII